MRTFLLMLASAFCGALFVVVGAYAYFVWQVRQAEEGREVRFPPRNATVITEVPAIVAAERFHGTHGSYAGEFPHRARDTILAAGPGRIVGSVLSDGKPLAGLRIRLALNGAAMSQWATSGADGRYEVAVPFGQYRVDGYDLQSTNANEVLAGKIDGPIRAGHQIHTTVSRERPGEGVDLSYVDPVRKTGPAGDFRQGQPIVARWEPYPGAKAYRLQLVEQKHPRDYRSSRHVFEWRRRPRVEGTTFDLATHKGALKTGHVYTVEIEAIGEDDLVLSRSPRDFDRADFRIID